MLNKDLFEKIKDNTVSNYKENIRTEYYVGNHWDRDGILTNMGISTIDKENPNKNYEGIVLNLSRDSVNSMGNLISGEDTNVLETNNKKLNTYFKKNNIAKTYNELIIQTLVNGKAYMYLYKKTNGDYGFSVLGKGSVFLEKNTNGEIQKAYIVRYEKNKTSKYLEDFNKKVRIEEYTTTERNVYLDTELISHEEGEFIIPVFEFGDGVPYLNNSLLQLQDQINIKLTNVFNVEKYNTDPITVIRGIQVQKGKNAEIDLGAGGVMLLSGEGSIEKISSLGLPDGFRELLEASIRNFYKMANLGALKNEDISGISSGYALELKLFDTLSYVKNFRTTMLYDLYSMFDELFYYFKADLFNVVEIELSCLIGERLYVAESEKKEAEKEETKSKTLKILSDLGVEENTIVKFLEKGTVEAEDFKIKEVKEEMKDTLTPEHQMIHDEEEKHEDEEMKILKEIALNTKK